MKIKKTNDKTASQTVRLALLGSALLGLSACVVVPMPTADQFPAGTDLSQRQDGSICAKSPVEKDISEGTTKAVLKESCKSIELAITNQNTEHPKKCQIQFSDAISEVYLQVGESRTLTVSDLNSRVPVFMKCRNDWNRTR
ncbi:MAG: hypothetical protein QE278_10295 [Limnobacter sp.]|nr:hypothetical protein [Limnobacter sp.]